MKFLVPVVIGAVIGYITNWLAIKMLFRPYEEKRIFGIKIPFTPGLIPKERFRIARSVGETVGTHLLSSDMLAEALQSEGVNKHIRVWIHEKIASIKESNLTIEEQLKKVSGDDYEKIRALVNDKTSDYIYNLLKKEEFQRLLSENLKGSFENSYDEFLKGDKLSHLKDKISDFIGETTSSGNLSEKIEMVILDKVKDLELDERNINEVIPSVVINTAKVYIYNHSGEITEAIKDIMNQEESQLKFKNAVINLIELNFGKMISMFMNPEMIASKILVFAENYLAKEENQKNISVMLINSMDKLLNKKICDVVSSIPYETKSQVVSEIKNFIVNYLNDKSMRVMLINSIEDKIREKDVVIKGAVSEIIDRKVIEVINSEKTGIEIKNLTEKGINVLLNKPSAIVFEKLETPIGNRLVNVLRDNVFSLINKKSTDIIELLDIPKIVEDRINSFDVEFAEKLILDIASKELRAITWLGALLGGIIGIITPLLQF
ncbi:hypothetical protein Q428_02875 [Fervidicella metallireducens AeB]|uniref:DUF445 family protein n=1 Tax=Fervidicella metallireducens AeB TaxID=1403537 RepID=A0A017RZQ2_9CLOT|nr:DUF445 family protein [Fervidicella metallireducens]EYE89415.1 hypothetical protein Q428_02875 [Fervidicella metallireducens AeB]